MAQPPRLQSVVLPLETPIIYFVTICVQYRERVLANPIVWNAMVATFDDLRRWYVCSAVVMPDHFHALVAPRHERDIPDWRFLHRIQAVTAAALAAGMDVATQRLRSAAAKPRRWPSAVALYAR